MPPVEFGSSKLDNPREEKTYPLAPANSEKSPEGVFYPGYRDRNDLEWGVGLPTRPSALSETVNALTLLRAMRHRWLLALTMGLLTASLFGAGVWFLMPEKYTAYALLRVSSVEKRLLEDKDNGPDRDNSGAMRNTIYQKTQAALITSRPVIRAALRQEKIRQLPLLQKHNDPNQWLEDNLIAAFIENTDILQVALTSSEPHDLATIVNAVQQAYLTEVVNGERDQKMARLHELEKIYASSQEKLRSQQEVLHRLADTLKTGDSEVLTIKQKNLLEEYTATKRELSGIKARLADAQMKLAIQHLQLGNEKGTQEGPVPGKNEPTLAPQQEASQPSLEALVEKDLDNDAIVHQQIVEVGRLEQILAQSENTLKADHPIHLRYQQQLQTAKELLEKTRSERRKLLADRMVKMTRGQVEGQSLQTAEEARILEKQRDAMQAEADHLGQQAESIGIRSIEMDLKRNEIQQAEEVSKALKSQKERLEVELQSTLANRVTLLEPAQDTNPPNQKTRLMGSILATMGGAFLGLFGVSYREFRTRKIYSSEEVSDGLSMKVLGSIPSIPPRELANISKSQHPSDNFWSRLLVESIDSIRTMLLQEAESQSSTVLMVTSARVGEGKTTLSGYLAASLARAGKKTLLIDCDLRSPRLHQLADIPRSPGVCEVLEGKAVASEAIHAAAEKGLFLLPAGQYTRETNSALAQGKIQGLFDQLRQDYQFIVVDSSPVLSVPDTLIIGKSADHAIFSIRPALSQSPYVYAAYERLQALRIRVLGTVVNGVNDKILYAENYNYITPVEK